MKNTELEFTDEQLEQCDAIENAAYQLACILCKKEDLEWSMEYIGEIADVAQHILHLKGYTTFYPAYVTHPDGKEEIIEDWVDYDLDSDNTETVLKENEVK